MNASPALIDTNILVYAFDEGSGKKYKIARDLVSRSFKGEAEYFVSTQNLAEFSVVVREKVSNPVPSEDVRLFLNIVRQSQKWHVLPYGAGTIIRAHEIRDQYGLHFWDSLLAATMEEYSVRSIYTEDAHFRNLPWITVVDPFA